MKSFINLAVASIVLSISQTSAYANSTDIQTRFGTLESDSSHILTLKGKYFSDDAYFDDPKSLIAKFELKNSDVLVINTDNGPSCPAQFYLITVSKSGAKSTVVHGECSAERVQPVLQDQTIAFTSKRMNGKGSNRYTFQNGELRKNGTRVP
jgi:hypothetical protein